MSQQAKTPPHNLEAEASLLGSMLLTTDAILEASRFVRPDHFYKPLNGQIFEAICALSDRGEAVDAVTVSHELASAGVESEGASSGALMALSATGSTSVNTYANIVYDQAILRGLIRSAQGIISNCYARPDDVTDAIDEAERLIFSVAQGKVGESSSSLAELSGEILDSIEEMHNRGTALTGTPTGFLDLDRLTSGLQAGTLVVVGARPAMGKSAFAIGMALNAAKQSGRPIMFFSLEMSKLEVGKRMLSSQGHIDQHILRTGRLNDDSDWVRIGSALADIEKLPINIYDDPNITVRDIRARARRMKSKHGDLGLIVIDYLQLMTGRGSAESRQVEVSEMSRGLKILARELETPVVALSQLSRSLEQRPDKRPMLSDLRESGAIEQDADIVMFLYRDDVYNTESPDRGQAEVIIAKHRAGQTGVVRLAWLPQYTSFENMATQTEH